MKTFNKHFSDHPNITQIQLRKKKGIHNTQIKIQFPGTLILFLKFKIQGFFFFYYSEDHKCQVFPTFLINPPSDKNATKMQGSTRKWKTAKILCHLKAVLDRKCPSLASRKRVVLHDNAHLHTAAWLRSSVGENRFPFPYSPNLAPSDYHLFRGWQKHLDGLRLTSKEAKQELVSYFTSKL